MADQAALRATFDTVASLYHEVRPGYPDVIIDAIVELAGLPAGGRILEIGCGTGQITRPFARRGYAFLALELGPALAALAAEHLRPYPQVHVVPVAFEDWPVEPEAFDLVLSAQALSQSHAFARLTTIRHLWQRQYTGPQFLKLLQTFSNHQTLPEPAKAQFFRGIEVELARFGNLVTRHYETLLLVAHKVGVNHRSGD
jgi:SAM-dependent methyltransferase